MPCDPFDVNRACMRAPVLVVRSDRTHEPVWHSHGGASVVHRTACGTLHSLRCGRRNLARVRAPVACNSRRCGPVSGGSMPAHRSTQPARVARMHIGKGGARAIPACGRSKGGSEAAVVAFAVGPCEVERCVFPAAPRRAS